jgi:signal transduction histidine kinase
MQFLLIDDNPYDRELIKRTLKGVFPDATYIEVIHQEALDEALNELNYAAVFTDYRLKWTTGIEVLKAIRARSTALPVIMVTDTGNEEIATEGMKIGLNDYVLKTHLSRLPLALKECLERVQLQAEYQELQAQMQQTQKMESLGLLVSGIAHDFNNLLTGIIGYAQRGMTQTAEQQSGLHDYFQHIHDRASHGARMTRQLLAFARGTSIEPKYINLNDQIPTLLDFLQTLLGSSIQVTFKPDPALQAIYADPTQLEQMLINLCINARDAMPTGGNLEITTYWVTVEKGTHYLHSYLPIGSYAQVNIRDTGIGMDEETQQRLFEPFFTTKDVGRGTGLGLSVVYGIIKQHHGEIRVQSKVGQGTTFSLYFPAAEPPATLEEAQPQLQNDEVLPDQMGSETILVVEDDPDIQLIISETLEEQGYTILMAGDGEEGVRLFEQHNTSVALVIADIMMPKMKGREFQEHIRRQRSSTKVLVISGYQQMDLQRRNLLDPASAFLQKPFGIDELLTKVGEIIRSSAQEER